MLKFRVKFWFYKNVDYLQFQDKKIRFLEFEMFCTSLQVIYPGTHYFGTQSSDVAFSVTKSIKRDLQN